MAQDYLDYTAFSRSGLIQQLEFEGFSNADATYAVDEVGL
ncbi:Ltp family lipoprotein [Sutcliffiella horikoshii]